MGAGCSGAPLAAVALTTVRQVPRNLGDAFHRNLPAAEQAAKREYLDASRGADQAHGDELVRKEIEAAEPLTEVSPRFWESG
jgi:hypothetical protein